MTARVGPRRDPEMVRKATAARMPPRRPRSRRNNAPSPVAVCSELSDEAATFRLLTWLSPAFPVGAFAYSSGIEWAVESGDVVDAATLHDWLAAMLADGAGFCDAVFLTHAHRAASRNEDHSLPALCELATAVLPSKEPLLETTPQRRAFIDITQAT